MRIHRVFILTYVHSYGFIAKISKASGIVSKNVQANTAQDLVCHTQGVGSGYVERQTGVHYDIYLRDVSSYYQLQGL
jgi:hypothetical protein